MTRKEEILNASNELFNSFNTKFGFENGVKWADEHPTLSWISVKEDLPCNHEELLINDNKKETKSVLAIINGYIMMSRMYKKRKWHWENDEPTYWFPIPELPKE